MLVLTRKVNEQILIGEDIRIVVTAIHGHQVRIGIEAPLSVPVFREEVIRAREEASHRANEPRDSRVNHAL